jgi:hypothetical protein
VPCGRPGSAGVVGAGGAVVVVVEVDVVDEGAGATAVVGPPSDVGEEQAANSRATVAAAPSGQRTWGRLAHFGHGNQWSVGSDTVREPRSSGWVVPVDHPAQVVVATWLWGRSPLAAPQPSGRR